MQPGASDKHTIGLFKNGSFLCWTRRHDERETQICVYLRSSAASAFYFLDNDAVLL
jgi:hypothetical protein